MQSRARSRRWISTSGRGTSSVTTNGAVISDSENKKRYRILFLRGTITGFVWGRTWKMPESRSIFMTAKGNWQKMTPGREVDSQALEFSLLRQALTMSSSKSPDRRKSGPAGQWFTPTNERVASRIMHDVGRLSNELLSVPKTFFAYRQL
jgi:hypothetical protein